MFKANLDICGRLVLSYSIKTFLALIWYRDLLRWFHEIQGGIFIRVVYMYVTELVQPKVVEHSWSNQPSARGMSGDATRKLCRPCLHTHSTLALRSRAQYTDHLFMIMSRPIDQLVRSTHLMTKHYLVVIESQTAPNFL